MVPPACGAELVRGDGALAVGVIGQVAELEAVSAEYGSQARSRAASVPGVTGRSAVHNEEYAHADFLTGGCGLGRPACVPGRRSSF